MKKDDIHLWHEVAKTVKPLPRARKKAEDRAPRAARPRPARPPESPALAARPPASGGKAGIDARIDLHGMTQDEAHKALVRFVRSAHRHGLRRILVITGKGNVKDGGGVLRRMVPLWAEAGPLRECVAQAVPAAQKDGGSGALYFLLKKEKQKAK